MNAPLDILDPGGDLIVASECSEGLGWDEFVDSQRRLVDQGPDGFLAGIRDKAFADRAGDADAAQAHARRPRAPLFREAAGDRPSPR